MRRGFARPRLARDHAAHRRPLQTPIGPQCTALKTLVAAFPRARHTVPQPRFSRIFTFFRRITMLNNFCAMNAGSPDA